MKQAIVINVHGKYNQFEKPTVSNEMYVSVDDDGFIDDAEKAALHDGDVAVIDRKNSVTSDQHQQMLEIAKQFDFSAHQQGMWEWELTLQLRKVISEPYKHKLS